MFTGRERRPRGNPAKAGVEMYRGLFQGKARLFPGFNAPFKCFDVFVAFFQKLSCPTGRRVLVGSGAIKNDLLIFGDIRQSSPELMQRLRSFERHRLKLFIRLIGADQQRFP